MNDDLHLPAEATVVEVGPRDGLQSEAMFLETAQKAEMIARLVRAGVREIEVTSFAHPSPSWRMPRR